MARREDSAQDLCDLRIRADRLDDRFNGTQRRINLLAGGQGTIGFRRVPRVE
jgi:hypothetical protein